MNIFAYLEGKNASYFMDKIRKYGHCALALATSVVVLLKLAYLPQRVYVQHTSKTKHSEEAL